MVRNFEERNTQEYFYLTAHFSVKTTVETLFTVLMGGELPYAVKTPFRNEGVGVCEMAQQIKMLETKSGDLSFLPQKLMMKGQN